MEYGMPYYTSISFWYYNTDAFPEGSPVNNWWDIIELDENGVQKYALYCKEIGSESTYLGLFSHFVANPDDLAKAYEESMELRLNIPIRMILALKKIMPGLNTCTVFPS